MIRFNRTNAILAFQILCTSHTLSAQNPDENDFRIGYFVDMQYMSEPVATSCDFQLGAVTAYIGPYRTSILNVLKEDGFNTVLTYEPTDWTSIKSMEHQIRLAAANDIDIVVSNTRYFQPTLDVDGNSTGTGNNIYDACNVTFEECTSYYDFINDNNNGGFWRPNYDQLIDELYTDPALRDHIWGYYLSEENEYNKVHHFNPANDCEGTNIGTTPPSLGHNGFPFTQFHVSELPPSNVLQAVNHFKTKLDAGGATNYHTIIENAAHGKTINASNFHGMSPVIPNETEGDDGFYESQQYPQLCNKDDERDVWMEGSYHSFGRDPRAGGYWIKQKYSDIKANGWHYLGGMPSVDYGQKFSSNVQKSLLVDLHLEDEDPNNDYSSFVSDPNIMNGNYMWLKVYTNIIHGAKGIWFWWLSGDDHMWTESEKSNEKNLIWKNSSSPTRFERNTFPEMYQNYIGKLSRELAYLKELGVISSDRTNILAVKTDSEDENCILPPSHTYIPNLNALYPNIPLANALEKMTEPYGIRYMISQAGDNVYLIAVNPFAGVVQAKFDFTNTSVPVIQQSIGAVALFEELNKNVTDPDYKVSRNNGVDLVSMTCGEGDLIQMSSNRTMTIDFGPLDVRVFRFVTEGDPIVNAENWRKEWSNEGSGKIGPFMIQDVDKYYTGDFDGDGAEELICVGFNGDQPNVHMNLLKYINGKWELLWTNDGNPNAGNGIMPYVNQIIVANVDGGADELIGYSSNKWVTIFNYSGGDWHWMWSTAGDPNFPITNFIDKMYAGNFDGDLNNKDKIFACDYGTKTSAMFEWNGTGLSWNNYISFSANPINAYQSSLVVGDYNGDGKEDLFGIGTNPAVFLYDDVNNRWGRDWDNNFSTSFGIWQFPFSSPLKLMFGNLDTDSKDEILIIEKGTNASTASTMEYQGSTSGWLTKWSLSGFPGGVFLNDWPVTTPSTGSNTNYILMKAVQNEPEYLLSFRKFCSSYLVSMYQGQSGTNFRKAKHTTTSNNVTNKDKESRASMFKVYPNPASSELTISGIESYTEILIINLKGDVVDKVVVDGVKAETRVDISKLHEGMYFIVINSNNGISESIKVIKN